LSKVTRNARHIVNAIGLGYGRHEELLGAGEKLAQLARVHGVSESRIHTLLPLTHLGPKVLKRTLTGFLPPSLTLNDLLAAARRFDWSHNPAPLGSGSP